MKRIILCAAIATFLAACSSEQVKTEGQATAASTSSTANAGATSTGTVGSTSTQSNATSIQNNPLKDPNNILSKRSVYFPFDKYVIDDKYDALILAHAAYLKSHPDVKVTLEGNADERGGAEYNLALGQKRAEAVRKMMELNGASAKQMEAISFGKEKPKAAGHNETAWAENRRTDVHYKGE